MKPNKDNTFRLVLLVAAVTVLFSLVSVWGYVESLVEAVRAETPITGWWVFWRMSLLVLALAISGIAAIWYIVRGSAVAANNASAVLLALLILMFLPRAVGLISASWYQMVYSAAWILCLGWLMWRVMPDTSLHRTAKRLSPFGRR